jgi:magnesium transporter
MSHWAYLYDADGSDEAVDIDDIVLETIGDRQLIWIDANCDTPTNFAKIATKLPISDDAICRIFDHEKHNRLDNYGDYFAFVIEIPELESCNPAPSNSRPSKFLAFVVGDRWLLTVHSDVVGYLRAFHAQDRGETVIGLLSPALLTASLLDWHLAEFFNAAGEIEAKVDAIDEQILSDGAGRQGLNEIVAARRDAGKLRKLISSQRSIFHGLSRPDFAVNTDEHGATQFRALADRYDRAVDEVERTRDVVIGSFELFASMSSEETNDLVKGLTFVTVVIGFSAAVAGLLGMNFDAPFFKSGLTGFIVASSALAGLSIIAVFVAKIRHWI